MAIIVKSVVLVIVIWTLQVLNPNTASALPDEYQVKAAILYNLVKFVKWPPQSLPAKDRPFIFCIISRESLSAWSAEIERYTVLGHRTVIKQVRTVEELDQPFQVLFIHRSMQAESQNIIEYMRNRLVLTVGDEINLARRGGIVNFIKVEDAIRIEVNVVTANQIGLNISSELLKLASVVKAVTPQD
jgi:hypothetical protein